MRLLTKAEACRELRVSLSTLNRRIAAGEVPVRREPRGRRHRVYVMLDDDLPSNTSITGGRSMPAGERDVLKGIGDAVGPLESSVHGPPLGEISLIYSDKCAVDLEEPQPPQRFSSQLSAGPV